MRSPFRRSSSVGERAAIRRGNSGTSVAAVDTESTAVAAEIHPCVQYKGRQMTTIDATCVSPHATMNAANIAIVGRNGRSSRRRMTRCTRTAAITKYDVAMSASEIVCRSNTPGCHWKHIPCGMKPLAFTVRSYPFCGETLTFHEINDGPARGLVLCFAPQLF